MLSTTTALASDLETQRSQFLRAEQLVAQNSPEASTLLEQLTDYPLYPYLQYQWLKKNLNQSEDIIAFLQRFKDSRYADLLRGKWLATLAEQQRWSDIVTYYQASDAEEQQCLYNQALYQTGQKDAALAAAQSLWASGEELPAHCNYLLMALRTSALFTKAMGWQRFTLALQHNATALAQSLVPLLPEDEQVHAKFWLRAHQSTDLINTPPFEQLPADIKGLVFADVIERLAHHTPSYATLMWDSKVNTLQIAPERREQVEYTLALALAKNKDNGAFSRLLQVKNADSEIKEWRVRYALLENNWAHVNEAINALPAAEQGEPRWGYWHARALWELDQKEQAKQLFAQVANKRDYYGYLAADYVDASYQLEHHPAPVDLKVLNEMLNSADIKLIAELRHWQREAEAQSQWWYLVKKADKAHIIAAAKIAQQWHWKHIAIFTIAKAEHWDDVELRFPIHFEEQVLQQAANQEVDPAVVLGLIRQESAFNEAAASPVGARGLMQIMPSTGAQIARELKQTYSASSTLLDPGSNIQFGSYYYKKLLQRFNGHFALAAAAYNAGPHRVDTWLPKSGTMAADIWVETIPFKETRKYVSSVLFYALIYQQRLHRSGLKMRDLLHDIVPFLEQDKTPIY